MSDAPAQLTDADVKGMGSAAIVEALHDGKLVDLLSGRNPEPPPAPAADGLTAAVVAEATARGLVDAEAAATLLDRQSIDLDADGNPTNLGAALDALIDARPWLLPAAPLGDIDQGARGGPPHGQLKDEDLRHMSSSEINQARREGRLDNLLGIGR